VHELAIAESIADAVCDAAAGRRVHCVTVRVGALEIIAISGSASCRTCGATVTLDSPILLCPCGSADLAVTAGRELQIVSMEVG
jgi:hydrogenase nickel incorporation protein HypA/HybF